MFQLVLILHIFFGSLCLLAGAIAITAKTKKGQHTKFGEIYHWSYFIVFLSAIIMAIIHWEESAYLSYIALFSYGLALLGYLAGKKRWKNWLSLHIGGMLGSYIGIITAVLVVNASKIPFLNDIPIILIWLLPTIIGTPLIFMVGQKYKSKKRKDD